MKKILKCLIILVILFTNYTDVHASTSGQVKYESTKYFVRSGAYFSGLKINVNIDGNLNAAYCISPGITLENNSSYSGYTNEQYTKLSIEKKENVELIAYFGYGYSNRNTDLWYGITQAMIWEEVLDKDVQIENIQTSSYVNYSSEKNQILSDIEEYKSKVTFNNNHYEIYPDESVEIQVNGKGLGDYTPKISNEYVVRGSDLDIGMNTIEFRKEYVKNGKSNVDDVFYFKRVGYQDLLVVSNGIEDKSYEISINVIDYSRIEILKIGSDGRLLEGVEFSLYHDINRDGLIDYNDKLIETLTTSTTGELMFSDLQTGKYIIIESKGIEGYVKNDKTYVVDLEPEQIVTIEVENKLVENKVFISKVDSETFENISGSTLSIYQDEVAVHTWVSTNQAHEVTLPYGTYQLCEDVAPVNYSKEDECIEFDVTTDKEVQEFYFENEKILVRTGLKNNSFVSVVVLSILFLLKIKQK